MATLLRHAHATETSQPSILKSLTLCKSRINALQNQSKYTNRKQIVPATTHFSSPPNCALSPHRTPRLLSGSLFCSYADFHFKESANHHRPSQPLPLTTQPHAETASPSCPASSVLLIDGKRMPWAHLWLAFFPEFTGKPASKLASPAAPEGRGRGRPGM